MSEKSNRRSISPRTALETIKQAFLTELVVDANGKLRAVKPLERWPQLEDAFGQEKKYRGCACKLIERQEMTEEQLKQEINRLVKTIKLNKAGKLGPGANLLDKSGNIKWAQDAARRKMRNLEAS